jgi:hypothetical protein
MRQNNLFYGLTLLDEISEAKPNQQVHLTLLTIGK